MIRTLEEVRGSRLAVNIREVAFAGNELTVRLTVDGSLSTEVTRLEARADEMSGRVDELRQLLAARDHLLDKATRQLVEVMTAVHGMEISTALRTPWTSWREVDAAVLARTVHRVRTILGTVERSPEPTDPETSQA